jgi:hypothetical protein
MLGSRSDVNKSTEMASEASGYEVGEGLREYISKTLE